jgi:hypothetical protein
MRWYFTAEQMAVTHFQPELEFANQVGSPLL